MTFSSMSALYKFPPTSPLSDPTQPLFTLKVVHHSPTQVVRFVSAIDMRAGRNEFLLHGNTNTGWWALLRNWSVEPGVRSGRLGSEFPGKV